MSAPTPRDPAGETPKATAGDRRGYWFALGKEAGVKEERARLLDALGITDAIADAITRHVESYHD